MSGIGYRAFGAMTLAGLAGGTGRSLAETGPATEIPPKVQDLLQILQDEDVRSWLSSLNAPAPPSLPAAGAVPETLFSDRMEAIREHLALMVRTIPRIPAELTAATERVRDASAGFGLVSLLVFAVALIALGVFAQWLVRTRFRKTEPPLRAEAETVSERARRVARSLALEAAAAAAFAAASLGPFLLIALPGLPRAIVMSFLTASLLFMIARGLSIVLLAPSTVPGVSMPGRFRLVPVSDEVADHYFHHSVLAIAWLAFGDALVRAVRIAGIDANAAALLAYVLGLGLVVIGLLMVWRRPVGLSAFVGATFTETKKSHFASWSLSLYYVCLWIAWVAGATPLFWLMAVALALPVAIVLARNAVYSLFRATAADGTASVPGKMAVLVETAVRTTLIAAAIVGLARAWNIGFGDIAAGDDPLHSLLRSLLIVLAILLVIDVAWRVTRSIIDESIDRAQVADPPGSPLAIRRAKLRTLLPIVRNVIMIFLATLALLMSLATLGVEIAPLVASAGVLGVAIGFGAQTVVKDIISGMFYLLDDAFRVGEYIVSGNFRGTVESFSLRSVRLRHHRGPVYTIPFGVLGAVQNLSRDYVVDKMLITVTYGADLEKARRLLKKVGQQLAEDPDLSNSIIETLKMQAIGDFGDYGIQLKLKMTTKPGEQYMVRKKAYPLIKKLFDENGIEFAYPTIRVIDGGDAHAAAAAHEVVTAAPGPKPA